jgi:hypothetical protein
VRLFGRSKPLHHQLADAAGLSLGLHAAMPAGLPTQPPGWDGEQRGEPGIHGVPRARKWDTVTVANAPALRGDAVHFVALPDGTLVVDEDEPDEALSPLADAVEAKLPPPYRAEAIRRGKSSWAVAARKIAIVEDSSLEGEEAELVVTGQSRALTVDGQQRIARAPGLQAAGEKEGAEFVVRASRVDGELWEVEATAL